MGQQQVFALLLAAQGEYLSGEAISKTLGVSRSAVWKSVAKLKEEGFVIDSVPNRGYSLLSAPNRLDKISLAEKTREKMEAVFPEEAPLPSLDIRCFDSIDSTNTEVKRLAMTGAPEFLVVTAEEQTAGRGRQGKSFHSPSGTGIYLSILLRPQCKPEEACHLTPWVAVALAEAIETNCGLLPQIKWCNDLILEGKKLSGILCEISMESQGDFVEYVVIGIGLNVNQKMSDFPEELRSTATSLCQISGKELNRNHLCAEIITSVLHAYAQFPEKKDYFLEKYRENCLTLGSEVQVLSGEKRRTAMALEIDDEFRLLLRYDNGEEKAISAGEVSLRGMYGYI
ncbi:MAG: biotin--[acetyl-CoA-carboxylase] ligase [Eubacteriales bacterium]